MLIVLVVPLVYADPEMDVLRFVVIQSSQTKSIAMQIGAVDIWPSPSNAMDLCSVPEAQADDLMTDNDIITLNDAGFKILQDPAFQVGFIGFNIRDTATIRSYYRPEITYWPFADVRFRHALIHCFDQLGILQWDYGFTVMHARSLVPQSQRKYFNPYVPEHLYNPGNPFTSLSGDGSSCGILMDAGYIFVDVGTIGVVDAADYWNCPNGSPLPRMVLWTPLISVAPLSYQHGVEFVTDLGQIGLAATTANGNVGILNTGRDLNEYLNSVYGTPSTSGGLFDAFMGFFSFGRLPDQLYTFCHSSQDAQPYPLRGNAAGINDATIDSLVETVEYSVDTYEIGVAAKQVQERLYDPQLAGADNFALAYMCLYHKIHFNAYSPGLEGNPELVGIVSSPGYGSDNKWTYLNINWQGGTPTAVNTAVDDAPDSFNPLRVTTSHEWEILEQVYDGLVGIDPYNHYDIPWIATDWSIVETVGGMNIYYTIRNDVMWQDGYPLTASDIEWCLEFIRDRNVPRYARTIQTLVDVVVTSPTTFYINCSRASIDLFYDFNDLATLLPRQIWDQPWPNDIAVLNYDPTVAYDVAPGYTPGPTPPPTNLFGTGPFVFQFYDITNQYSELWGNDYYFMTRVNVQALMTEMFWEAGDQNRDGVIDVLDLSYVGFAYGSFIGEPQYDPNSDFNQDGFIGMKDLVTCSKRLLWQREY